MTIGQTVMDTVSGAVTVVSGSGSGGRVPGEVQPRLRGCLSGRLFGCRLAGMAGGLTLPAGEASARAWV
jgi:hypothetical protein